MVKIRAQQVTNIVRSRRAFCSPVGPYAREVALSFMDTLIALTYLLIRFRN